MMEVELAGTCSCGQSHNLQYGLSSGVRSNRGTQVMPNHLLQASGCGLEEDLVKAHGAVGGIPLDVKGGHGGVADLHVLYAAQRPWTDIGFNIQVAEGLCLCVCL